MYYSGISINMKFWTKRKIKEFEKWKKANEDNMVYIINEDDYEKFMEKYIDENEVHDVLRKIVDDVVESSVDKVCEIQNAQNVSFHMGLNWSLAFLFSCILWLYVSIDHHDSFTTEEEYQYIHKKGFADFLRGLFCRINSRFPHCVLQEQT